MNLTTLKTQLNIQPLILECVFNQKSKSDIIPTVGFTVETFETNRVTFTAFDMSGQGKYRNLWKHYYSEADAIVFVVDASDRERMAVARQELEILLDNNGVWFEKK